MSVEQDTLSGIRTLVNLIYVSLLVPVLSQFFSDRHADDGDSRHFLSLVIATRDRSQTGRTCLASYEPTLGDISPEFGKHTNRPRPHFSKQGRESRRRLPTFTDT